MFLRVAHILICVGISSAISACSQGLNYGTGYFTPEPATTAIDRTAWLARVKLPDSFIGHGLYRGDPQALRQEYAEVKNALEEALTMSTFKYLQRGNYFKEVRLLPGSVREDDLVLRFEYDRYIEESAIHPVQWPFIFLFPLLPFYAFFNGPIGMAGSDLSGTLVVEDSDSRVMAEARSTVQDRQTITIRSSLPQINARTKLLNVLLAEALVKMQNGHGHEE